MRMNSCRTLVLNMFGLMGVSLLTSWIGMMIYAKYYLCDPISAKVRKL